MACWILLQSTALNRQLIVLQCLKRSEFGKKWTHLTDRHLEQARHARLARSQALAWERTVLEALPPEAFEPTTIRQAEPVIHAVPRQSLGTSSKLQALLLS